MKCNLLISESPVTKIRPRKLSSIIYCIVWSSFSLQRAKTSNSQIHRVTEWTVCMWVTSKLTYRYIRDVCFIATRAKGYQALSPSLLFIIVMQGESLGMRLWMDSVRWETNLLLLFFCRERELRRMKFQQCDNSSKHLNVSTITIL